MEITAEKIQEMSDALGWRVAEGRGFSAYEDRYYAGLTAGWNAAHREIAKAVGLPEPTSKSFGDRITIVPCPDGHETFTFDTPGGKKKGVYRCECGHEVSCFGRNAREHHDRHRESKAIAAMEAQTRELRAAAADRGTP